MEKSGDTKQTLIQCSEDLVNLYTRSLTPTCISSHLLVRATRHTSTSSSPDTDTFGKKKRHSGSIHDVVKLAGSDREGR